MCFVCESEREESECECVNNTSCVGFITFELALEPPPRVEVGERGEKNVDLGNLLIVI